MIMDEDRDEGGDADIRVVRVDFTKTTKKKRGAGTRAGGGPYVPFEVSVAPEPRKTRVVTDTSSWSTWVTALQVDLSDPGVQWRFLQEARGVESATGGSGGGLVASQLRGKLRGYRNQDIDKGLYQDGSGGFVTYPYVLALLYTTRLMCCYCGATTMVVYEGVREPKQWTLERIDNRVGHNIGNVQIACLTCNLRRRTMFQERYHSTVRMKTVRRLDHGDGNGDTENSFV
jgi:hypothetical protein